MTQDQTLSARRHHARPLAMRVIVSERTAHPQRMLLEHGDMVLGAGKSADLVIDDLKVSRRHARLTLRPEGVEVCDLGSRNGTYYLGQRIGQITLAPGSSIVVGSAHVHFEPVLDAVPVDEETARYGDFIGRSPAALALFALLRRLEGSLVNVLIAGESGVGKELVARGIHAGSRVHDGPLAVVNCGSLQGDLVRSELFGHSQGAFTGASSDRCGAFESADGGTLFLDEVGELPLDVQPMLLRALEEGEVQRVGEVRPRQVKVRVLAATNRDLAERVTAGDFREDLFFRLAVVTVRVPPLRERRGDIAMLARHIAHAAGLVDLPPDVVARFESSTWPGNVRELRNAVQAYTALGHLADKPLVGDSLAAVMGRIVDLERPLQEQTQEITKAFGRAYLEALLDRTGGNLSEAARRSGLDRSYLRRLLQKHGVTR